MKNLLICFKTFSLTLFLALRCLAIDTAGSMLKVDASRFNHPGLTSITWTGWIYEYDIATIGLRIEFNSVGFRGTAGATNVAAMVQNVGHGFLDDASTGITSFPALGLYFSNLDADLADNRRGVKLLADPTIYPRFGRVFENVDGGGFSGKNIYTRQDLGMPTFTFPILVRWTVTRQGSVTNPPENLSKDINGNWVPLIGTFMKWRFKVDINGTAYDVADYYLPIERAEFLSSFDPLTLHQEYFGSATQNLGAQKGTIRFTDLRASDGINWFDLNDWKIVWRIDDEAGNLDNRFGWKSDGVSLISRVGHQEDIVECLRNPGGTFALASRISPSLNHIAGLGGNGNISVMPGTGQSWTAVSNNYWITINTGHSGIGNGTVSYSVGANQCPVPRSGTMTVGGQIFTVFQAGNPASLTVAPTNQAVGGEGGNYVLAVTTGAACPWAASTEAPWITLTSGATGTGNGSISFVAAPNFTNLARTGVITVSGKTVSISQAVLGNGQPGDVILPRDFSQPFWLFENYGGAASTVPLSFVGNNSINVGTAVFSGPTHLTHDPYGFVMHDQTRNLVLEHALAPISTRGTSIGFKVTQNGQYVVAGSFARACDITNFGDGVTASIFKNFDAASPYFNSIISSSHSVSANDPFSGTGISSFRFETSLNQGDVLRFMTSIRGDGFCDLTALGLIIRQCTTLTINQTTLPNGTVSETYNQTLTASGGADPYLFSLSAGALPSGLSLSADGTLSGTPKVSGTFNFTLKATDANGCSGARTYTITISGLMFYPLPSPVRLLDTRPGASPKACSQPNTPIAGGASLNQPARNFCGIPANAAALTGNVTTVQSGGGFLTLYPSDATQPTVASTNYAANEIVNNVFTVGLGTDGAFKIFAFNTTDVVVDVTGYYAPPSIGGLYFHPLPAPVRLLETRAGQQGCVTPGAPLTGNADSTQQAISPCTGIPAAARAIVGNATTVNPQGGGFLTLFPGDAARPLVASSNYNPGQIVNGPFSVGLSATGQFKLYTFATTDLVVDVLGYYSTEANDVNGAGLLFTPLQHPVRLLETRVGEAVGCFKPGAPLNGQQEYTQTARGLCDGVTVPTNALGVVGNATVIAPNGGGFLTLWPSTAASRPLAATANYNPGGVVNRHFIVGLGQTDGAFKMDSFATTNLVIDLSGYFAP